MKNPRDQPTVESEMIETAAATWLCERDAGFEPGRAQAFQAWSEADPRHAAAAARVERSLALLSELPRVRSSLEKRLGRMPATQATSRSIPFLRWAVGLAAVLVLGGLLLVRFPLDGADTRHYAAGAGSPQRVTLPDGSVVNVNARSEITVRLTAQERRITLTQGEAHFEVAHDTGRPFTVTAGGVAVRAVGTAFNVRMADKSVEVLVTEGKVELTQTISPASPDSARPSVSAGEQALVMRNTQERVPRIEKADPDLIRRTLAWHSQVTSFSDMPLRELVGEFNRRNTVQLIIAEEELGARKMGGSLALNEVEALVRLLEQDGDVVVVRRSPTEIVLRRAR